MGTLIGVAVGAVLFYHALPDLVAVIGTPGLTLASPWSYSVAGGGLFGLLFYFITPSIVNLGRRFLIGRKQVEKVPTRISFSWYSG